jgi:hypothetical protein
VFIVKKKQSKNKPKTPFDKHHIFYIRKEWNKGDLDKLRLHPYCIVKVRRSTLHRQLHTHLAYIPAPKECYAQKIIDHLKFLEDNKAIGPKDTLEKRLAVLISIFEFVEQPTADALKEQLRFVHEFKNPLG